MLKVVVDTNVLISALIFGGNPDEVLKLARFGEVELYLSEFILQETTRVLRTKFHWSKEETGEAIDFLRTFSTIVTPQEILTVIRGDESDNRILECAQEAMADFLVTGDTRHLQPLKQYGNIKIVSPSAFLRFWQSGRI